MTKPGGKTGFRGRLSVWWLLTTISCVVACASSATQNAVPMEQSSLSTYYVRVSLMGGAADQYLVDTGAGYMTITEATLNELRSAHAIRHLGSLEGVLADGHTARFPVYLIPELTIGGRCRLVDVEVAVIPGATRGLLGLSALRKASPFSFSFAPPEIALSRCLD